MGALENIITNNLLIWSSAIQSKSSAGRGTSSKHSLYGVRKLRELILDLAVRGLLVPQDLSDEPASVLLEKIAAEKQRLSREGKIKKQKRLQLTKKDENTFCPPQNWVHEKFGNIYTMEYGRGLKKSDRTNTGEFPVYGSNGIVGTHESATVFEPCIVIGRKGSAGALNLCLNKGSWVTDVAYSIVPPTSINLNFSFIQLQSLRLDELGRGIKPGLNRNEAYLLDLFFPPLAEQKRIVAKVDELMALCDTLEQQQEESIQAHELLVEVLLKTLSSAVSNDTFQAAWNRILKCFDILFTSDHSIYKLKETILELALMGKLVAQDPNNEPASVLLEKIAIEKDRLVKEGKQKKQKFLSDSVCEKNQMKLPKGWSMASLGSIGKIFNGNSINSKVKNDKYSNGNGLPFIATKDIGYGFENFNYDNGVKIPKTELDFKIAKKETVFICAEGGSAGRKCGINSEDVFFGNKLFANELYGNIDPSYILINYMSPSFFSKFKTSMTGIIGGISLNHFMNLEIPLPPLQEQKLIVAKVNQLFNLCEKLKTSFQISQKIRIQLADSLTKNIL